VLFLNAVPPSVAPASAADLHGTWQGTGILGGEEIELTVTFSPAGHLLFNYEDNRGNVRTVELSEAGHVRFVPPGGGVKTMSVVSVNKRPGGISYVLETSFERTSGGLLDQQYISEQYAFELTREGLAVRRVSREASYIGDKSGPLGGPKDEQVLETLLKKVE
jgi:hypothetical protein